MAGDKNISTDKITVTCSPHIHCGLTVSEVMRDVNVALIPAVAFAIYSFRFYAIGVIIMSLLGAISAEYFTGKLSGKKHTLNDGSAIVTGLLLALCLPPNIPAWIAFVGGFISIALGKQIYGGLGQNIFNPAHVGRAILLISWPVYMTTWLKPLVDGVTTATPLGALKVKAAENAGVSLGILANNTLNELGLSFSNLFIGSNVPGSIGETSKLALIIGGIYLIMRGHIRLHAPLAMVSTVFAGAYLYSGSFDYALFHLLTGGLILGSIFMVTDMVTSPVSDKGNIVFGIGCGLITLLIRLKGGYPEGVCFSILIMNSVVPLIDKLFKPKRFGTGEVKNA